MEKGFSVIVAVDNKNGIGKEGDIPWNLPEDMRYFNDVTSKNYDSDSENINVVIMGRVTWESIPKKFRPFKNRINVVVSRTLKSEEETGVDVHKSFEEALYKWLATKNRGKIFVIGGVHLYNKSMINKYCNEIYLTRVYGDFDCDRNIDEIGPEFEITSCSNLQVSSQSSGQPDFRYLVYTRKERNHPEYEYLNLIKRTLENGITREDRTGTGTISCFGEKMVFDLNRDGFPILTTKRVPFKMVVKELLWFLAGDTNNKHLQDQGVHIWDGNTSREFLDNRGLNRYQEGDIGACFVEGTPVLTKTGYKCIENIEKNNEVYTHLGNWKNVENIQERKYSGKMYKIIPKYQPKGIECTPEHPFYARKFIVKDRHNGQRNFIYYNEPEWVEAKNLDKKTLLGFKIETKSNIPCLQLKRFNRHLQNHEIYTKKLDNLNDWFMFGYFLGDGWIVKENNCDRIHFVINFAQEKNILAKLKLSLPNLSFSGKNEGCNNYKCVSSEYSQILCYFKKYAHLKIIPWWVHDAPVEYIQRFLDGYRSADGCLREQKNEQYRYTTVSTDIAYSLQRLYLKLGIFASIQWQKRDYYKEIRKGHSSFCRSAYFIDVYPTKLRRNNYSVIKDGYAWFSISSIISEDVIDIQVFNFEVKDDNSYTINCLSVHNCYGYQWRHFGAPYQGCEADYKNKGVDQIKEVIRQIKEEPTSRRILFTAWNPSALNGMALLPCHSIVVQFYVREEGEFLDCQMYQRSADVAIGIPFNITSYAVLLHMISQITNLKPGKLILILGDSHIYSNHIEQVNEQLSRKPRPFPILKINPCVKDIDSFTLEDFQLIEYRPHKTIKMKMAI